jgi:iron complex outermembrane receptor protein
VTFRLLPLALLLCGTSAFAQRTTTNAVTASDDAFGRASGTERIGIYSPEDVRGFNPIEAGNARIEGLYFDQTTIPSNRLIDNSSIRVGYAAQAFPFPAPTGIVNLLLEKFDGQAVLSLEGEVDAEANYATTIQAKLPLAGDKLGIAIGHGLRRSRIPAFRYIDFNGEAINVTWRPKPGAEFNLFWSHSQTDKTGGHPILYPAGNHLPPEVERRDYIGQDWAHGRSDSWVIGTTAKLPMGNWRAEFGLFRSIRDEDRNFADLALGIRQDGVVTQELVQGDINSYNGSTSGEFRLIRQFGTSDLSHRVTALFRGRVQDRDYGGQAIYSLEQTNLLAPIDVPEPALTFGPKNRSQVRQFTYGLAYELASKNGVRIGASVQRIDYRKTTDFGNPALADNQVRDRPWLFAANAIVPLAEGASLYGGYVRGLEESPNAPDIAENANEAPPAGRTKQMDLGLRYAVNSRLTVIAGAFQIDKPYYNLNAARNYGVLGAVRYRGLEFSLTGTLAKGLTLVAGTLLLDPRISGAEVAAGRIGQRPVGVLRRRSVANLDWRPGGTSPWSFDLAFEGLSGVPGNAANTFSAPSRETIGMGLRYRFDLAGAKLLARAQVFNLLDDYGWRVSSSGGYSFNQPRTVLFTISADI